MVHHIDCVVDVFGTYSAIGRMSYDPSNVDCMEDIEMSSDLPGSLPETGYAHTKTVKSRTKKDKGISSVVSTDHIGVSYF